MIVHSLAKSMPPLNDHTLAKIMSMPPLNVHTLTKMMSMPPLNVHTLTKMMSMLNVNPPTTIRSAITIACWKNKNDVFWQWQSSTVRALFHFNEKTVLHSHMTDNIHSCCCCLVNDNVAARTNATADFKLLSKSASSSTIDFYLHFNEFDGISADVEYVRTYLPVLPRAVHRYNHHIRCSMKWRPRIFLLRLEMPQCHIFRTTSNKLSQGNDAFSNQIWRKQQR